ncbi:phosphate ABC transporter substrate-binding protein PstS [Alicyclobacillus cycloheptanicus]|uniref:Phosphate-binding protein n=1 Tax=Alicyclobacillus cycloheptanicus TaxID=1457 RepID=A0ABT9XL43_9BACL|nr:phosphate ABC transporter substrate-binding protein PstS [Alicyclobacillus cycloheptanicus]MDQ0191010.1 phosphate transport system substrate-binding protein [Alicyclobacillus cycloheptanicus]WDM00903.1 phosphate ABC transporter substrate-binding protein PstS [Alicyclobacillus cycloheptanicus]
MNRSIAKWATGAAAVAVLATVVGCGNASTNNTAGNGTSNATTGGAAAKVTLNEVGSSLLYPLFAQEWVAAYKKVEPSVTINAAAGGSGKGISDATSGNAQIGASDAYLPPSAGQNMENIPLAISAQQIMYNLPGVTGHLKLTGDVLAKIYLGQISYWDDPAIQSLNSGVSLPHQKIIPVYRSDSSGDSFLFTSFLSDTNATWKSKVGENTAPSWPSVAGSVGANGNDGVVAALAQNKYSIGYVGISWLDQATQKGLGYAALQNKAGNFVLPTTANIQAAANAQVDKTPANESISLIDGPGANSYPIINFEYAIVNTQQPDANTAAALKKFLDWAISPTGGNTSKYLSPVHFLPLPSKIETLSQAQIDKIGS